MPRKTVGKASASILHTARENRRSLTLAEQTLWNALRGRQAGGLKFRRQHPVAHFVLDFFCLERMLAVEVDGGIHQAAEQKLLDQNRTIQLNELGIRVLRFTNEEILNHLPIVLEKITACA